MRRRHPFQVLASRNGNSDAELEICGAILARGDCPAPPPGEEKTAMSQARTKDTRRPPVEVSSQHTDREKKLVVGAYWVDERATAVSDEFDEKRIAKDVVNEMAERVLNKVAGLDMYEPALDMDDDTNVEVWVANSNANLNKPLAAIPPRADGHETVTVIARPRKDAMAKYALKPWNQNRPLSDRQDVPKAQDAGSQNVLELLEEMRKNISALQEANDEKTKSISTLQKDNQGMRTEISAQGSTISEQGSTISEQGSTISEQGSTISKQREEIRGLKGANETMTAQLAHHNETLDQLRTLIVKIAPLHLRVLLDKARIKIVDQSPFDTWESLRDNCGQGRLSDLTEYVAKLPALDLESASFICQFNNVRREGNEAAHNAEEADVGDAIMQKPIESGERRSLEGIFEFVYEHKL